MSKTAVTSPPCKSDQAVAPDAYTIDKRDVASSFGRAASTYDASAIMQRKVGDRLMEKLDCMRIAPQRIVDIGCGTGHYTAQLSSRFKKAKVLGMDLAEGMVQYAQHKRKRGWLDKTRFLCGDAEALPLASNSVDLVFSNLALQWLPTLDKAFAECYRVLRPGGLLLFSSLGPDTLKELRAAWSQVDGYTHVNRFIDMHDVGDALMRGGFADPVMEMEMLALTYRKLLDLMKDLKHIGAHNVNRGRATGLTGRARMQALEKAYEAFRCPNGELPASYEVLFGHAWVPAQKKSALEYDQFAVEVK